ncbi:hypothetical protein J4Q44_G00276750, partial [Coregonus suidteri]
IRTSDLSVTGTTLLTTKLPAAPSIAKQSLAGYSVKWVCGPNSGFKSLFSMLKMINIQHWPCCQSSMISAALKTTVNSELGNLTSVSSRQLGTLEKTSSDWENTF